MATVINAFNGGLSTVVHPHFIKKNESVIYNNVDHRRGSLIPRPAPVVFKVDKPYSYITGTPDDQNILELPGKSDVAVFQQQVWFTANGTVNYFDSANTVKPVGALPAPDAPITTVLATALKPMLYSTSASRETTGVQLVGVGPKAGSTVVTGNGQLVYYKILIVNKKTPEASQIVGYSVAWGDLGTNQEVELEFALDIDWRTDATEVHLFRLVEENTQGKWYSKVNGALTKATPTIRDGRQLAPGTALADGSTFPGNGSPDTGWIQSSTKDTYGGDVATILSYTGVVTAKHYSQELMSTAHKNQWKALYPQPVSANGTWDYFAGIFTMNTTPGNHAWNNPGVTGTYKYAVTRVDTSTGIESAPTLSTEVKVETGFVAVALPKPTATTSIKLYRIGGALTKFSLVGTFTLNADGNAVNAVLATQLTDSNITATTATTFTLRDSFADDQIEGSILASVDHYPPETGVSKLIEAYAMLFVAKGDKLLFSKVGEPHLWPKENFLDFQAPITGIGKGSVGLLVFTATQTHLVTGTSPEAFSQQLLSGDQGCIDSRSIKHVRGEVIWASSDGVCTSTGGRVKVITRAKLGKIQLANVVDAVVYDQTYYLAVGLMQGTTQMSNVVLCLDLLRDVVYTLTLGQLSTLVVIADRLLYVNADNKIMHLPVYGTTKMAMSYKSPEFSAKALITEKHYKNIYVSFNGAVTITVHIDCVLILTKSFTTTKCIDTGQVKLPVIGSQSRGVKIQFGFSGSGTVYELVWGDGSASE